MDIVSVYINNEINITFIYDEYELTLINTRSSRTRTLSNSYIVLTCFNCILKHDKKYRLMMKDFYVNVLIKNFLIKK